MKQNELREISLSENHQIYYRALEYFDLFCRKYQIHYFILWGTLLGQARSNDFIPWDDDVDVGMSRKELARLLALKTSFDNSEFSLVTYPESKKSFSNMVHVKIKGFFFSFKNQVGSFDRRVSLDIFSFDSCPRAKKDFDQDFRKLEKISRLLSLKFPYFGFDSSAKMLLHAIAAPLILFPTEAQLHERYRKIISSLPQEDLEDVFFPDTSYDGRQVSFKRSWFETIEVSFGPLRVFAPVGSKDILQRAYGPTWRTPIKRQTNPILIAHYFVDGQGEKLLARPLLSLKESPRS